MTKAQFEIEIKKMVLQCIPVGGNGTFLRQLIFHGSTVIDWDVASGLIKALDPELKKKIQELEKDYGKFKDEMILAKRKLSMPRKIMSEVYANLDKYRKTDSVVACPTVLPRDDNWKVGDMGTDTTDARAQIFIVVEDKPSKNI